MRKNVELGKTIQDHSLEAQNPPKYAVEYFGEGVLAHCNSSQNILHTNGVRYNSLSCIFAILKNRTSHQQC